MTASSVAADTREDLAIESRAWWRDSLGRRMLAAADAATVTVFSLPLALFLPGYLVVGFWVEAMLPLWLVLAKLHGLYDRDDRTLRHLMADEVPSILLWVLSGTAATALIVPLVSDQSIVSARLLEAVLITFGAAVSLRCAARFAWRRVVPPHADRRRGGAGKRRAAEAGPLSRDPCAPRGDAVARKRRRGRGALGRAAVAAPRLDPPRRARLRGRPDHGVDRVLPRRAHQAGCRSSGTRTARRRRQSRARGPSFRSSSTTPSTSHTRRCS